LALFDLNKIEWDFEPEPEPRELWEEIHDIYVRSVYEREHENYSLSMYLVSCACEIYFKGLVNG